MKKLTTEYKVSHLNIRSTCSKQFLQTLQMSAPSKEVNDSGEKCCNPSAKRVAAISIFRY